MFQVMVSGFVPLSAKTPLFDIERTSTLESSVSVTTTVFAAVSPELFLARIV
jgi:hypothetical protein